MEIRTENINLHKKDGTTSTTVITHLYSRHGHFLPSGWHAEISGGCKPEDYVEVIDEGVEHEIPSELPDVDIFDHTAQAGHEDVSLDN